MSRPAPPGQHVGQPLSPVPRRRARHLWRWPWKRSSNAPPGSTCTRARWSPASSSVPPAVGVRKEVRTFGTMRQDLAALRAWLLELGVTHVGMEGDRRLLAAGARRARGWRLHPDRRQRLAHAQRARPRDRREGRRVDRRPGPARAGARQLRAAARGPGAARPRPPPRGAGRHAGGGAQPHAQAARERRDQARRRDERRVRRLRHADARGPGGRDGDAGGDGRPRQAAAAAQARPARPGPRRAPRRAPAPAAHDAHPAPRGDRPRPRRGRGRRSLPPCGRSRPSRRCW